MTIRIPQTYAARDLVNLTMRNRADVNKYSQEVSSGKKVRDPGESNQAATISQFQEMMSRIDSYQNRIASTTSVLTFQDDIMSQANELLARAKEIATQAANDTNGPTIRNQMAGEVFQIRDQLVTLANSTYQGRYIFGGVDDDDPPYDLQTYVAPTTGPASQRYVFDAEAGTDVQRTVQVTDDLSMTVSTQASTLFNNSIQALERLGRAMVGYDTQPATGAPTGAGAAFTFPTDFAAQTEDIRGAIDLINTAREDDIMPERVSIGARLSRLSTASELLELNKTSSQEVLSKLQDADIIEAASMLSQAQTAYQASMQVTLRALNLSILDFL
jgi:flagellar hook-associated protein 3 FlgL